MATRETGTRRKIANASSTRKQAVDKQVIEAEERIPGAGTAEAEDTRKRTRNAEEARHL